jgi:hypothetical protein
MPRRLLYLLESRELWASDNIPAHTRLTRQRAG